MKYCLIYYILRLAKCGDINLGLFDMLLRCFEGVEAVEVLFIVVFGLNAEFVSWVGLFFEGKTRLESNIIELPIKIYPLFVTSFSPWNDL